MVCLCFVPKDCLLVGRTSGALQLFHLRQLALLDSLRPDGAEFADALAFEGPWLNPYAAEDHALWVGTKKSVILCAPFVRIRSPRGLRHLPR